jgi:hypothetical protein
MKHMTEHDETGDDDRIDPIALSLRQQANAARLQPSAAIRERTLEALRRERSVPHALPFRRAGAYQWRTYASAAAMLAVAAATTWLIWDRVGRVNQPVSDSPRIAVNGGASSWTPPRFHPNRFLSTTNASVRLATFTRPLEDEAAALQSDLKRLTNRVRNVLPRVPGKSASPDATH